MAARELGRSFHPDRGAVVVDVEDDFGTAVSHTIHISHDHEICPACGHHLVRDAGADVDVDAEVKSILAEADARAAKLLPRLRKAGWQR